MSSEKPLNLIRYKFKTSDKFTGSNFGVYLVANDTLNFKI